MKKKYILLLFSCLLGTGAYSQTLAKAKELYEKGEYAQAKPAFQRFVKSNPSNGNYNLWYGVCCLKTDEAEKAVKPLEIAVKRRVPSGQLYLAQAYHQVYRFEDAVEVYEEYIAELKKRKRSTDLAESLLQQSKIGLRQLKGVEEVCIIDSVIVDKKDFLKAYKIGPEAGKLFMYNEYFKDRKPCETTVYETELGTKIYYAEYLPEDSTLNILASNKQQDSWSKGTPLPGAINEGVNANYPYVMSDGITIYYAADGPASIGGYDIFVTRYNTENATYLNPQNVGMPFNSPYNDYMYVVDEYNNLGWFASDRHQPEGKVCIYVFIPNATKQVYSYENTDHEKLLALARLSSIKQTWTDNNLVAEARQRMKNIETEKTEVKQKHDFEFIVDDRTVYYQMADFRSPQAKKAFQNYRQLENSYAQQNNKLENLRKRYASATQAEKEKMAPGMLDIEKRIEQLADDIERTAIQVRQLEKGLK